MCEYEQKEEVWRKASAQVEDLKEQLLARYINKNKEDFINMKRDYTYFDLDWNEMTLNHMFL